MANPRLGFPWGSQCFVPQLRLDVASLEKANVALKAAQQQLQEDNSSLKAQLKALQQLADQQSESQPSQLSASFPMALLLTEGAMEVQSKADAEELEKVWLQSVAMSCLISGLWPVSGEGRIAAYKGTVEICKERRCAHRSAVAR